MKRQQKFLRAIQQCQMGEIDIETPEGKHFHVQGSQPGPRVDLQIKDWALVDSVLNRGDIGLGEAYSQGLWESSDVAAFLSYCILNLESLQNYAQAHFFNRILFYFYNHWVKRNSKQGSKTNIKEHYDIGNDFYQQWLDPSMTYSSALRYQDGDTLFQAQAQKYHRILDILSPNGAELLEIGCGWGGFAEKAIEKGAHLTGITISNQQYAFAKQRLAAQSEQANIIFEDYRNIQKKFDAIVSIEMFEAVGERYWPTYFNKLKDCLVKSGRAVIQTITIRDELFKNYRKDTDYIRHYVFPGGMLPSKKIFSECANKAQLEVKNIFEFGKDYAWTLKQWLKNFTAASESLLQMGYNEAFMRSWRFYLNICIAGFETGRTNVMQVELQSA